MSTSNLKWSVMGGVGIEFKLSRMLGLYFEPGVIYYFDDGTNIPNIRKDRPLNLNLQIGMRFNLK